MKVIGLTGGIGSGKSTVSQFLAELGAVVIDTDKVGHEALKPGGEAWQQVVNAFGEEIATPPGDIDRRKLGEIVFNDAEALAQLNRIVHPRIYDMVRDQLEEYRQEGVGVLVLEVPLLVEAGWTSLVDEVWVTVASEATVLKRIKERTGLSEQESLARIRSQLPLEERISHADVAIDTDCSLDGLKAEIKELWQKLQV